MDKAGRWGDTCDRSDLQARVMIVGAPPTLVRFAVLLTLVCGGLLWAPAQASAAGERGIGRILAGRGEAPESASQERKELMTWYGRQMKRHWAKFEARIGEPLNRWARAHVPEVKGGVVFYPFGGPDFVTVHRVFPKADRYVLIALQKGGRVPRLHEATDYRLGQVLRLFEEGIKEFAQRGFFLTKEMNRLFDWDTTVEGMTGIIAAFAELEGFDILKVEPIRVHPETVFVETHPGDHSHRKRWGSVRLYLQSRAEGRTVIIDYIRMNLYDEYLRKIPGQVRLVERMALYPTFLKAASHLLQQDGFASVREALLDNATLVVQDESGLGYTDLLKHFDVKLFGRFTLTNKLFRGVKGWRELAKAFKDQPPALTVDFPIGYKKPAGSCLMVAKRKAESPLPGSP